MYTIWVTVELDPMNVKGLVSDRKDPILRSKRKLSSCCCSCCCSRHAGRADRQTDTLAALNQPTIDQLANNTHTAVSKQRLILLELTIECISRSAAAATTAVTIDAAAAVYAANVLSKTTENVDIAKITKLNRHALYEQFRFCFYPKNPHQ